MSYALEAKKRKFDRILESLTEGSSSQSRPALNSRNNAATVSSSQDTAPDTSKRRRITPSSLIQASKSSSTTSLATHYLPSSRTAFLDRLETFRHVTKWHIPSTENINAAEWAKRGWTCVDTDTVSCGYCRERLWIDLQIRNQETKDDHLAKEETEDEDDERMVMATEVYNGVIKRYQEMMITAHLENCPWQKRGCDKSIQRIEGLLNMSNALSGIRERYENIASRSEEIPEVSSLPEISYIPDTELTRFDFNMTNKTNIDALRLAICGWGRKCDDVLECKHCFRSLGLWLYRGDEPTMEKLNALESHLEYCPWRSTEAQDTEVSVIKQDSHLRIQSKEQVAGWLLVYQALAKSNAKNGKTGGTKTVSTVLDDQVENSTRAESNPEQREKKMKDLLRRIKELRRPFNVKALLRKKERVNP